MRELQTKFNLLQEENNKNLNQNGEYRTLILGNEDRMKEFREEIKDLITKIDMRDKTIEKQNNHIDLLKNET